LLGLKPVLCSSNQSANLTLFITANDVERFSDQLSCKSDQNPISPYKISTLFKQTGGENKDNHQYGNTVASVRVYGISTIQSFGMIYIKHFFFPSFKISQGPDD